MIGMKIEDHFDGATNFIPWKSRVLILEENDLLKLVNEKVPDIRGILGSKMGLLRKIIK